MIQYCRILLSLILICYVQNVTSNDLPAGFKKCKIDGKLNDCLQEAIQGAFQHLRKGIPELHVNSIDPLEIDDIRIRSGNSAVQLDQHYYNVKIQGVADAVISNIRAFVDNSTIKLNLTTFNKELTSIADYELKGKLLAIPLEGRGKISWTMVNITYYLSFTGKSFVAKGKTYMKIEHTDVDLTLDKAMFYIDNLFDGNKVLTEQLNKAFNENWKEVLGELKPGFLPVLVSIFQSYANSVLTNVPFNRLVLF